MFDSVLKPGPGKDILELGSTAWRFFVDFEEAVQRRLVSINISEAELEKGRQFSKKRKTSKKTSTSF